MTSLNAMYQKWNHFGEDSDDDEKPSNSIKFSEDKLNKPGDVEAKKYIDEATIKKIKKLERKDKEMWQLYVRRMRYWRAGIQSTQEKPVAVRPWTMILSNLFPLGRVVDKQFSKNPEAFPDFQQCMDFLVKSLLEPEKELGVPHRPSIITFENKQFIEELGPSIRACGIVCDFLNQAEGISEYVQSLSKAMIENEIGVAGELNTAPSLHNRLKISESQIMSYYKSALEFYQAHPWTYFGDRQVFFIRANSFFVNTSITVNAGYVFGTNLGISGPKGVAIFYNQAELENRVKQEDGEILNIPGTRVCANCAKLKFELLEDMKRCNRCKTVHYCSVDCQKKHWPFHKLECLPISEHPNVNNVIWGFRETSCIFSEEIEAAFDDLDFCENNGIKFDEGLFPQPFTYRKGNPDLPKVEEFIWLERAFRVSAELSRNLAFLAPSKVGSGVLKLTIDIFGKTEEVEVVNASVLMNIDIKKKDEPETEDDINTETKTDEANIVHTSPEAPNVQSGSDLPINTQQNNDENAHDMNLDQGNKTEDPTTETQ